MNALYNLIPHFIDEQFAAASRSGSLDAVTLFMDMSGFTAMTQAFMERGRDGAETLSAILNHVFTPVVQAVYEQKGFITGFAGDAFTALFPIDEPLRACAAALNIHTLIQQKQHESILFGDFTIAVRMGLSAGPVTWGIVGPESQRAYFFRGRAIDDCTTAEEMAQPGDIILDERIQALLRPQQSHLSPLPEAPRLARLQNIPFHPAPISLVPTPLHHQAHFFPHLPLQTLSQGEFREAAIVFISFNADLPLVQLDQFASQIIALAGPLGGHFNELDFGDKGGLALLYFGAPVTHERDKERALNFLLALQENLAQQPIVGLRWRASVSFGLVYAGMIGAPRRGKYTCLGSTVNLAARQVDAAAWGHIVVSEMVAQQPEFRFARLGTFSYKGFAEPIPTYRLLGIHSLADKFFARPMVGRDAELEQLQTFAAPLAVGRWAGVALLYGEPGIGKSRLTYALRQALGEQVSWFVAQADPILPQAFGPFVYWLRRYFGQMPEAAAEVNRATFEMLLQELLAHLPEDKDAAALHSELTRTQSCLGALLGHHWPGSLYESLDAQGRYHNSFQAIKTLLLAESCLRPVVLALEDAHRMDEASHELLTFLTRQVDAYPLLLVVTSRYHDDGSRPRYVVAPDTPVLEMALEALPAAALSHLAVSLLHHPITPALQTTLLEKSQANPFFAEQLLHYFRENNLLTLTPQGWALSAAAFAIPSSINAILIARIDRLTAHVKEVVKVAAVLGREFEVRILSQVLRADVLPDVKAAEQEQIWAALSELRYIFRHTLLRDAAYEMQLRTRLRELHRLAAAAYEQLHAADLTTYYPELAYHYGQAHLPEQERQYALKAAEQAAAQYANQEAIHYFSRVLELTPPDDGITMHTLLMQRVQLYDRVGDREGQWQDISHLLALTQSGTDETSVRHQVEARLLELAYIRLTKNYAAAAERLTSLVDRLALADMPDLAGRTYTEWGEILLRQGQHAAAKEKYQYALFLARQAQNPRLEAFCLNGLGNALTVSLAHHQAQECLEEALRIRRELGDRQEISVTLLNLGSVYSELGESDRAMACYEECLQLKKLTGELLGQAAVYNNLGNLHVRHGNLVQGQQYFEQALHLAREVNHRRDEAIISYNLGYVAWQMGDMTAALSWLDTAQAIVDEIGLRIMRGFIWTLRGRAFLTLTRYDEAALWLEQALAERQAMHLENLVIETQAELIPLYHQQGLHDTARQLAKTVLAFMRARDWEGMEDPFGIYWHCWQVFREQDETQAQEILSEAYHQLQTTANRIQNQKLRQNFLHGVPSHHRLVNAFMQA